MYRQCRGNLLQCCFLHSVCIEKKPQFHILKKIWFEFRAVHCCMYWKLIDTSLFFVKSFSSALREHDLSIKSPLQEHIHRPSKREIPLLLGNTNPYREYQFLPVTSIRSNPYREYQSFLKPILIGNTNLYLQFEFGLIFIRDTKRKKVALII